MIVYFDLETGGLDANLHPIIQLAAVVVSPEGNLLADWETKIAFDPATADPQALEVNHYAPLEWVDAPSEATALATFTTWLRHYADVEKVSPRNGRKYSVAQLAGHNAGSFDMPFLKAACKRNGLFLPANPFALDTLQLAYAIDLAAGRRRESYRLESLCEDYQVPIGRAHDALADVRATAALGAKLLAELRGSPSTAPAGH